MANNLAENKGTFTGFFTETFIRVKLAQSVDNPWPWRRGLGKSVLRLGVGIGGTGAAAGREETTDLETVTGPVSQREKDGFSRCG